MTMASSSAAGAAASSSPLTKIDPVTAVQDSIDALALSLFEALRGVRDAVASSSSLSLSSTSADHCIISMSAFKDTNDRITSGEDDDINNNNNNNSCRIIGSTNNITGTGTDDETLIVKQKQQQQAREKLLDGLNMDYFPPRAYDMLHPDYESFILSYLGGVDGCAKELVERFHSIQKTISVDTAKNEKIIQSLVSEDNGGVKVEEKIEQQQQKQQQLHSNTMQIKTTERVEKEKVGDKDKEDQDGMNCLVNKAVGEVGYVFRKEFESGWYTGKVVEIRPLAENGFDRRCVYSDGDTEDLRLEDLEQLAKLDPNHGNNNHGNEIHQTKKPRLCIKLNVSKNKPLSISSSNNGGMAAKDDNMKNTPSTPIFPMSRIEYIKLLHDAEHHRDNEITTQLAANELSKSNAVNDLVANLPGMERTRSMQLTRINELIEENRRVASELDEAFALANKLREDGVRNALRECTALALNLDEE